MNPFAISIKRRFFRKAKGTFSWLPVAPEVPVVHQRMGRCPNCNNGSLRWTWIAPPVVFAERCFSCGTVGPDRVVMPGEEIDPLVGYTTLAIMDQQERLMKALSHLHNRDEIRDHVTTYQRAIAPRPIGRPAPSGVAQAVSYRLDLDDDSLVQTSSRIRDMVRRVRDQHERIIANAVFGDDGSSLLYDPKEPRRRD